jgi:hypothetical protein
VQGNTEGDGVEESPIIIAYKNALADEVRALYLAELNKYAETVHKSTWYYRFVPEILNPPPPVLTKSNFQIDPLIKRLKSFWAPKKSKEYAGVLERGLSIQETTSATEVNKKTNFFSLPYENIYRLLIFESFSQPPLPLPESTDTYCDELKKELLGNKEKLEKCKTAIAGLWERATGRPEITRILLNDRFGNVDRVAQDGVSEKDEAKSFGVQAAKDAREKHTPTQELAILEGYVADYLDKNDITSQNDIITDLNAMLSHQKKPNQQQTPEAQQALQTQADQIARDVNTAEKLEEAYLSANDISHHKVSKVLDWYADQYVTDERFRDTPQQEKFDIYVKNLELLEGVLNNEEVEKGGKIYLQALNRYQKRIEAFREWASSTENEANLPEISSLLDKLPENALEAEPAPPEEAAPAEPAKPFLERAPVRTAVVNAARAAVTGAHGVVFRAQKPEAPVLSSRLSTHEERQTLTSASMISTDDIPAEQVEIAVGATPFIPVVEGLAVSKPLSVQDGAGFKKGLLTIAEQILDGKSYFGSGDKEALLPVMMELTNHVKDDANVELPGLLRVGHLLGWYEKANDYYHGRDSIAQETQAAEAAILELRKQMIALHEHRSEINNQAPLAVALLKSIAALQKLAQMGIQRNVGSFNRLNKHMSAELIAAMKEIPAYILNSCGGINPADLDDEHYNIMNIEVTDNLIEAVDETLTARYKAAIAAKVDEDARAEKARASAEPESSEGAVAAVEVSDEEPEEEVDLKGGLLAMVAKTVPRSAAMTLFKEDASNILSKKESPEEVGPSMLKLAVYSEWFSSYLKTTVKTDANPVLPGAMVSRAKAKAQAKTNAMIPFNKLEGAMRDLLSGSRRLSRDSTNANALELGRLVICVLRDLYSLNRYINTNDDCPASIKRYSLEFMSLLKQVIVNDLLESVSGEFQLLITANALESTVYTEEGVQSAAYQRIAKNLNMNVYHDDSIDSPQVKEARAEVAKAVVSAMTALAVSVGRLEATTAKTGANMQANRLDVGVKVMGMLVELGRLKKFSEEPKDEKARARHADLKNKIANLLDANESILGPFKAALVKAAGSDFLELDFSDQRVQDKFYRALNDKSFLSSDADSQMEKTTQPLRTLQRLVAVDAVTLSEKALLESMETLTKLIALDPDSPPALMIVDVVRQWVDHFKLVEGLENDLLADMRRDPDKTVFDDHQVIQDFCHERKLALYNVVTEQMPIAVQEVFNNMYPAEEGSEEHCIYKVTPDSTDSFRAEVAQKLGVNKAFALAEEHLAYEASYQRRAPKTPDRGRARQISEDELVREVTEAVSRIRNNRFANNPQGLALCSLRGSVESGLGPNSRKAAALATSFLAYMKERDGSKHVATGKTSALSLVIAIADKRASLSVNLGPLSKNPNNPGSDKGGAHIIAAAFNLISLLRAVQALNEYKSSRDCPDSAKRFCDEFVSALKAEMRNDLPVSLSSAFNPIDDILTMDLSEEKVNELIMPAIKKGAEIPLVESAVALMQTGGDAGLEAARLKAESVRPACGVDSSRNSGTLSQ